MVDADADAQRLQPLGFAMSVPNDDLFGHRPGTTDSIASVVRPGLRRAKCGHQAITQILVQCAAVGEDRLFEQTQELAQQTDHLHASQPGADPRQIRVAFDGAYKWRIVSRTGHRIIISRGSGDRAGGVADLGRRNPLGRHLVVIEATFVPAGGARSGWWSVLPVRAPPPKLRDAVWATVPLSNTTELNGLLLVRARGGVLELRIRAGTPSLSASRRRAVQSALDALSVNAEPRH